MLVDTLLTMSVLNLSKPSLVLAVEASKVCRTLLTVAEFCTFTRLIMYKLLSLTDMPHKTKHLKIAFKCYRKVSFTIYMLCHGLMLVKLDRFCHLAVQTCATIVPNGVFAIQFCSFTSLSTDSMCAMRSTLTWKSCNKNQDNLMMSLSANQLHGCRCDQVFNQFIFVCFVFSL